MYSASDMIALYTSWLAHCPTVPKTRVILDGTGDAQNVPNVGSASALDGCLLAVHEYTFFGSDTWTSESQWVSHFKGEVGNYADRTVCTEWGGPMSPGSKNGVSYGALDYSKSPTNFFEAYIRGMSSQLRAWNMGSFYWVGLKDGDWYSMTTRSGTGSGLVLSVPNQSGLAQLQNAWPPATAAGGTGGQGGNGANAGRGGTDAGGGAGHAAGNGSSGSANNGGRAGAETAGSAGAPLTGGTGPLGTGGSPVAGSGGSGGSGGSSLSSGGMIAAAGGLTGTSPAGGPPASGEPNDDAGCSCKIAHSTRSERLPLVLSFLALLGVGARRRRQLTGTSS